MVSLRKIFLTVLLLLSALPAAAYERIISLYPGHTDNIVALGGAARLVGLSKNDNSDLLPELPRLAMKTGAEAVLALNPDLVLTRSLVEKQNPELKNVLERAGVTVILLDPPSWDGFPDYLRTLAPLAGADGDAAAEIFGNLCAEIRAEAAARRGNAPAPSVFVEATSRELHTCAPDSWAAHLIHLAGGKNAAESAVPARRGSAVALWGLERVMKLLASGLDVYLVQNGPMNRATPEDVENRPWAAALGGVKIAQIAESVLSRPSLLGLREGGRALIEIFYGE